MPRLHFLHWHNELEYRNTDRRVDTGKRMTPLDRFEIWWALVQQPRRLRDY